MACRGSSLSSVAAQKVRYWVRHFGRVFTFSLSVPQRQNSDFDVRVNSMARAARDFFKGFGVLAPGNRKNRSAKRQETEGLGLRVISYFLSDELEGSGS